MEGESSTYWPMRVLYSSIISLRVPCLRQSVLLKNYVVNFLWNSPHTQKIWLLLDLKTLHWYFLGGMHGFLEAMHFSVSGLSPDPVTYWWLSVWSGSLAETGYLQFKDFIDAYWFEDIDLAVIYLPVCDRCLVYTKISSSDSADILPMVVVLSSVMSFILLFQLGTRLYCKKHSYFSINCFYFRDRPVDNIETLFLYMDLCWVHVFKVISGLQLSYEISF